MTERTSLRFALSAALLLVSGITLFFLFFPGYDDLSAVDYSVDRESATKKAESLAQVLGLDISELNPSVKLGRNSSLISDHQRRNGLAATAARINQDLPGFYWNIEYKRPKISSDSATNGATEALRLEISTQGLLLEIESEFDQHAGPESDLDESGLRRNLAFRFLNQSTEYDSAEWVFGREDFSISREDSIYRFDWENYSAGWADTLVASVELKGERLASLSLAQKENGYDNLQEEAFGVASAVLLVTIIFLIIVQIVKRLRQDKIDLRMGWTFGAVTAICWGAMTFSTMIEESWWEILLVVVFGGAFFGLVMLVLVATGESLARDVWNEKLYTLDSLIRGRFKTVRVGRSFLAGLGLTGMILMINLLGMVIADAVGGSWIERETDFVEQISSPISSAYYLGEAWTSSAYILFAFVVFGFSFLRRWIVKSGLFIASCGLLFAFLPDNWISLSPSPISNLHYFAIGAVLAWALLRHDFLTILVSMIAFISIKYASPLFVHESVINGLITGVAPIGFLALGILSIVSPQPEEHQTEYIPPYLLRISERERFQRELEIARTVQLKFLPHYKLESNWLDVASVCIPAYEVGGDYYDFFQLDTDRLGVVVGDVSGKGVSAAFFMTLLKGILVSQTRHMQSPKEILIQMNDLFYENAQRGVFISIVYGVFDRARKVFTYARAGHNPVIVLGRQNRASEQLCPQGIALGLDKGEIFANTLEEVEIDIHDGDIFVFYTDGFSEAMDATHEEFGEERLGEAIKSSDSLSAHGVLRSVQDAVRSFTGNTQQHDDMTMVVVRIGQPSMVGG